MAVTIYRYKNTLVPKFSWSCDQGVIVAARKEGQRGGHAILVAKKGDYGACKLLGDIRRIRTHGHSYNYAKHNISVETPYSLTIVEEKLARKNELKARGTLLMALPSEHQLKFKFYKTAESLMEAIKKIFGGDRLKVAGGNVDYESQKIHIETGRNLCVNGTETIGFGKTKMDCYNCHRRGHFARKCKASKHQDNKNREAPRRTMPAEDGPTNFTLMAYASLSSLSSLNSDTEEKEVSDSRCSRHMTGNMSYLFEYEKIDGGYVAFGGDPKGGKITVKGGLTCLFAKATLDESNLWDRRLRHINFKTMNKLAEAVNTACYVQNRVLVIKPQNKTPYDLFLGRKHALSFLRPFGCPVTILNTLDHLGKFDGKANEGFFVGYSTHSKTFKSSKHEVADDARKKSTEVPRKVNGVQNLAKEGDKNNKEKDVRDQEEATRHQFEQESERLFGQGQ
uniref:Ribonuclease H-like domain-containing protein n=1 Tax=Tanacetum cinerariifolium TaxID=118510 RepID=A0A6L2MT99_TANCI|nr:ribonuclease H-like domain-containing protein [Tanacetum cinerariifolium]